MGPSANEHIPQDSRVDATLDSTQMQEPLAGLIASAVLCIAYFLLRALWAIGARTIRQLIALIEKTCFGLFTELLREARKTFLHSEQRLCIQKKKTS